MHQRDYSSRSSERPMRQLQMGFLNRKQSQRHAQILEEIMEKNLRKESGSFHDLNISQSHSTRKMLQLSRSKKDMDERPQPIRPPTINNQTHETHQQVVNEEPQKQRVKYEFNIISHAVEVTLAYGITIGIDYLYRLGTFPYYQLILIVAFALSITPYYLSSILVLSAAVIAIVNNYIGMSIMTYPSILICYLAALTFNERFKVKILFILTLAIYVIYGFVILPALYQAFGTESKIAYYYLFPLFMFIFRVITKFMYWIIGHTTVTFLQLPFFLTGLQYGTILSLNTSQIQFWYLIVFFTLEIVLDRTQIMVIAFNKISGSCRKQEGDTGRRKGLLVPQSSGYNCIHSLHIVCLIYIYSYLPLYYFPYTATATLSLYVNQWYKPLLVWILTSVYELMCMALERRRKDKLLIGFKETGILATAVRTIMLVLGFWFFYLGLAVGNYVTSLI